MHLFNHLPQVPAAVGPYSQAVSVGNLLFCSGQLPIVPASGKIEATDIEGQTDQVLANLQALLASQELNLHQVVKTTVFLQNMADFPRFNARYEAAFNGHKPARSTVQVAKLPLDALVEIEAVIEIP